MNELKARAAFNKVTANAPASVIIASAEKWVAKVDPTYLPKLEDWLIHGAWQKNPPVRRRGGGNKPTPAEVAAMAARERG